MKKEDHAGAMFVVSGYSIILFCRICLAKLEEADDGPDCYHVCRRRIRRRGWILHKDGYCTCKNCK